MILLILFTFQKWKNPIKGSEFMSLFDIDIEKYILESIVGSLHPEYFNLCDMKIINNIGTYNSIVVNAPGTIYRNKDIVNLLFARLKTKGKKPYISFNKNYSYLFSNKGVSYYEVKSDEDFFRIDLNDFVSLIDKHYEFSYIMQNIFNNLFALNNFGCCDLYLECSNEKKCIHPDLIYAIACFYRKNLSAGKIFYGENRNS